MYILIGYLTITIYEAKSLKDKRKIIKSIIDTLKSRFKISVAEVDFQNNKKLAAIGLTSVSSQYEILNSLEKKIENFLFSYYPERVEKYNKVIEKVDESIFY